MNSAENLKSVYQVRTKNGGALFEGSFEDMVKWLAANKVSGNDEMRRLGFAVLEKDEIWGRLSDFPEFHHSDREGRRMLFEKRKAVRSAMFAAAAIFLIGLGLIAWNQAWPRYLETSKVAESRKMAEDALKDASERINAAVTKSTREVKEAKEAADKVSADALSSAAGIKAAAEKLKAEALYEKATAARSSLESAASVAQMKAELSTQKANADTAIKDKQKAEKDKQDAIASLQAAIDAKTASLNRDLKFAVSDRDDLKSKLDKINKTLPLLVRWKSGVIQQGKDFEYFNYSRKALNLRFKVTLMDGSVKEKSTTVPEGGWFSMPASLHDDFKAGETVTIFQDNGNEYEVVVHLCP